MENPIIPLRPEEYDRVAIKKTDADIMTYAVLTGVRNEEAFRLFHHEYLDREGRLTAEGKKYSRQFFSFEKNKEYMEAYRRRLGEFVEEREGKKPKKADSGQDKDGNRKDRAIGKLVSDCLDAIEGNSNLNPETLKDFVAMAMALGVLKDEEGQTEPARRFLPVRCGECMYRSFVESHMKSGEIENECLRCKALAIAQEHGYRYDPTTNLDIAQKEEAND